MIRKILLVQYIIISLVFNCFGQINPDQSSYIEIRSQALDYFPDKADSTIILMEYAYRKFPDEFLNSSTILAQVYIRVDEFNKAIEIWNEGINRGYAYGLDNKIYQQYFEDNSEFNKLVKKRVTCWQPCI